MQKGTGICPGCRKQCDLATPRCHVGKAYAKTGILPDGKKREDRKEQIRDDMRAQVGGVHGDEASGEEKLADMLRAVSRALRHGEGTLDALSAEEKRHLGALVEKAWAGMKSAPNAEGRSGDCRHHGHKRREHHADAHKGGGKGSGL